MPAVDGTPGRGPAAGVAVAGVGGLAAVVVGPEDAPGPAGFAGGGLAAIALDVVAPGVAAPGVAVPGVDVPGVVVPAGLAGPPADGGGPVDDIPAAGLAQRASMETTQARWLPWYYDRGVEVF